MCFPPDGADDRNAALDLINSLGSLEELTCAAARRAELRTSLTPDIEGEVAVIICEIFAIRKRRHRENLLLFS